MIMKKLKSLTNFLNDVKEGLGHNRDYSLEDIKNNISIREEYPALYTDNPTLEEKEETATEIVYNAQYIESEKENHFGAELKKEFAELENTKSYKISRQCRKSEKFAEKYYDFIIKKLTELF